MIKSMEFKGSFKEFLKILKEELNQKVNEENK